MMSPFSVRSESEARGEAWAEYRAAVSLFSMLPLDRTDARVEAARIVVECVRQNGATMGVPEVVLDAIRLGWTGGDHGTIVLARAVIDRLAKSTSEVP